MEHIQNVLSHAYYPTESVFLCCVNLTRSVIRETFLCVFLCTRLDPCHVSNSTAQLSTCACFCGLQSKGRTLFRFPLSSNQYWWPSVSMKPPHQHDLLFVWAHMFFCIVYGSVQLHLYAVLLTCGNLRCHYFTAYLEKTLLCMVLLRFLMNPINHLQLKWLT